MEDGGWGVVSHSEQAAQRDPYLLHIQADEEWASLVEMQLHQPHESVDDGMSAAGDSDIFILQFQSHPREFYNALDKRTRELRSNGADLWSTQA